MSSSIYKIRFFSISIFCLSIAVPLFSLSDSLTLPEKTKIEELFFLSDSLWNEDGPFDRNIDLLSQAESLASRNSDWENQALALLKLSTVYYYKRDDLNYNLIVDSCYQVAKQKLSPDYKYFKYISNKLSKVYRKKRAYKKAIEHAEYGIKNCEKSDHISLAQLYNKLAENYISLGDYSYAKKTIETALSLREKSGDKLNFCWYESYDILGYISKKLGDIKNAISWTLEAESILIARKNNRDNNELLNLWIDLAKVYIKDQKLEKGNLYLERFSKSNYKKNDLATADFLFTKALAEYSKKNYSLDTIVDLLLSSNQYFDKAKTLNVSLDVSQSKNLTFLGEVLLKEKQYGEAKKYYSQAIEKIGYSDVKDELQKIGNKSEVINILSKLFDISIVEENYLVASEIENRLIDLIKILRIENNSESTKNYWAQVNLELFEKLISYNFKVKNYDRVFSLIDENKSNLLIKGINESSSLGYGRVTEKFIEKEKELRSELAYYRRLSQESQASKNIDSNLEENIEVQLSAAEIKLKHHISEIEKLFPEYYKLKYDLSYASIESVQKLIDNETTLVEYFIGPTEGYAAIIGKNKYDIVELSDLKSLETVSLNYYKSLKDKSSANEKFGEQLLSLSGLDGLMSFNPKAKKIIIIADDFLNNIPFENLKTSEGQYLYEFFDISYQDSNRLWQLLEFRKSEPKKYKYLGFAYSMKNGFSAAERSCADLVLSNLDCASVEVEKIYGKMESERSKILESRKRNFLEHAAESNVLHLATHACLDENNSENSRVYFNDGYLTNADLKLADIRADLVVLSGCETGYGEIVKGEGSMSLAKGFFHAGAKSALVSLWQVDDCATANFMGYFYDGLLQNQPKDQALRNAKLKYIKTANPERSHPFFWAGFVVIGDCSPIWNNSNQYNLYIYSLILIGLLVFGLNRFKNLR